LAEAGAGDLPGRLAATGIGWRHFPIVDYGAPDADDPRWPPLAAELHTALDAGGRVLLHCHGGKGRSGMVALRLLVERGAAPAEALAAIRAARPGAVETAAQEAWGGTLD
jgi:protein-tyrosine phosphatase